MSTSTQTNDFNDFNDFEVHSDYADFDRYLAELEYAEDYEDGVCAQLDDYFDDVGCADIPLPGLICDDFNDDDDDADLYDQWFYGEDTDEDRY